MLNNYEKISDINLIDYWNKIDSNLFEQYKYTITKSDDLEENKKTHYKILELLECNKKEKFSGNFGDSLLFFLNNFSEIINELQIYLSELQNNMENNCTIWVKENITKILPKRIFVNFKTYNEILNIIENDINTFNMAFLKLQWKINSKLKILSKQDNKASDELNKILDVNFYTQKCYEFGMKYIDKLEQIYILYTNSYINILKSPDKQFSNFIDIPSVKIKLDEYNPREIQIYEYEITNFLQLMNIYLYQIILNKKVLVKCQYCNEYFFTRTRNDEIYCHKIVRYDPSGFPTYCGDIARVKKYELRQHNVYKLYKSLFDRLKMRIKKNDENIEDYKEKFNYLQTNYKKINDKYQEKVDNIKKYEKNYESLKNEIYEIKREELREFLVKFDKEFQKKYPIHKGRKYDTQKYWTENKTK